LATASGGPSAAHHLSARSPTPKNRCRIHSREAEALDQPAVRCPYSKSLGMRWRLRHKLVLQNDRYGK
jgi:hypothetical protein